MKINEPRDFTNDFAEMRVTPAERRGTHSRVPSSTFSLDRKEIFESHAFTYATCENIPIRQFPIIVLIRAIVFRVLAEAQLPTVKPKRFESLRVEQIPFELLSK